MENKHTKLINRSPQNLYSECVFVYIYIYVSYVVVAIFFLGRTSKTHKKIVCHVRHTQIISQAAATFVLLVCGIKEPTKYIFVQLTFLHVLCFCHSIHLTQWLFPAAAAPQWFFFLFISLLTENLLFHTLHSN